MSSSTPGINGRLHSEVEALCAFGALAELRQTQREELSQVPQRGGLGQAHLEGWEVLGNAGKMWENMGKMLGKCGNLLILSVLFSEHISEYMEIWWNIDGNICNIDGTFMEKSWNIIQQYDDKWGIYCITHSIG